MYLDSRRKKRRSSPWRVLILLLLIGAGIYVYLQIKQERVETPFVPTPTPTRSAVSYVSEAETWYWEGDLAKAIAAYERAIALDPDDVTPHIPLARLLALEGRTIEAVEHAEKATRMAPDNAEAWAVLGMVRDWNGNVEGAIEACKHAIELKPDCARAYAYLAEAYIDDGLWGKATEAAKTALKLDDNSVDAHRNYGYVLERQGNYWQAVEEYKRALEIHPNLAYLHLALGRNQRDGLNDLEAARESFGRAAELASNPAAAYSELGWTYHGMGDFEEARSYLEKATEADPQLGAAFGRLAIIYWARRNYEDAISNFERAIALECAEARRKARAFYITLEERGEAFKRPSSEVVMNGAFEPVSEGAQEMLRAELVPVREAEAWSDARGTVTLNVQTGGYSVTLEGMPRPGGRAYVGWFEGINALSGNPLNTGVLGVKYDGSLEANLETGYVEGPRIEYFYTLGLAHFYMAECEKAYPLFDAALQIDPEEKNALEGIKLCREAEKESEGGDGSS